MPIPIASLANLIRGTVNAATTSILATCFSANAASAVILDADSEQWILQRASLSGLAADH